MANLSQLIHEISSDEEATFGDIRKDLNGCSVSDKLSERDDHNWLTKLLGEVDKKEGRESDDVVLVKEMISDIPKKSNLQVWKPLDEVISKPLCDVIDINSDSDDDGDDDDCVVLDGDPDKPVLLLRNGDDCSKVGSDSDDGVEVVGEKGEVACRDFPHSRHLCAKFIFSSTLHQNHCSQCHCYVCDTLAPCINWGTGTSDTDHCHASDKEDYWRTERKRKKTSDNQPRPVSIKSFLTQRRQSTQAAPQRPIPQLPCQSLRPATVLPCSVSTNVNAPGVVNPSTGIASGLITPRSSNGIAPRVVYPSIGIIPQRHITSNVTAPRIINPRTGIAQRHITPRSSNVTMTRVVNPSTGIAQGHITPRSSNVTRTHVVNPSTGFIQRHITPRLSSVSDPTAFSPSQGHITPRSPNITVPGVVNPSTGITQGHVTPRSSNVTAPSVVNPSVFIAQGHVTSSSSNVITPSVSNPSTGIAQGNTNPGYTPSVSNPCSDIAQGNTNPGYKRNFQTLSLLHVNSMRGNFNIEKTSQPFLSPPAAWSGYGNGYCQSQSTREPYLKRCRTLPTSLSNGSYASNQQNTASPGLVNSSASAPSIRPQLNPEPIPTHPIRSTSGPQIPSQQYVRGTFGNGLPSQSSMGTSDNINNSQPNLTVQTNSSLLFKDVVSNQPTCSLPSETNVSYQTNIGNNTPASQPQPITITSLYRSMCNTFENPSFQSHAYNNPSYLSIDDKNGFLEEIENDMVTNTVDFDMELEAFLRERDVQASIDTSPTDNNQYLSVPKGAQNSALKDNFQQQSVVAQDNSLSPGVTDSFQFERPMFQNRSLSEAFAGSVSSPIWNEFSPDNF